MRISGNPKKIVGYDKKGILAGVSESILDTADNVSRTFDSAQSILCTIGYGISQPLHISI